jgi:hypothetical protein
MAKSKPKPPPDLKALRAEYERVMRGCGISDVTAFLRRCGGLLDYAEKLEAIVKGKDGR